MKQKTGENGFTIVEIVVTVAIVSLFLGLFFQMYFAMESQRVSVARQSLASDIAYTNLRKFTVRPPAASLPCAADGDMDLTGTNPQNKPGATIGDSATDTAAANGFGFKAEPTSVTSRLGANSRQLVKAYAPKGCSGSNYTDNPIKIESIVTYGTNEKVIHASYIN